MNPRPGDGFLTPRPRRMQDGYDGGISATESLHGRCCMQRNNRLGYRTGALARASARNRRVDPNQRINESTDSISRSTRASIAAFEPTIASDDAMIR